MKEKIKKAWVTVTGWTIGVCMVAAAIAIPATIVIGCCWLVSMMFGV